MNEQTIKNKQKNKLIEADNRLVLTKGQRGCGESETSKGVDCMVTVRNQTLGSEPDVVYSDVSF